MSIEDIAIHLDNHRLHLIIMPTEKCNFRCTYCYESFENGMMKAPTINGIKALLKKRSDELTHLEIGWFGGEPLLAKAIIQDIGGYAKELSEKHGFKYSSSMSTNGSLLTEKVAKDMRDAGVQSYQISVDGYRDQHDKYRVNAAGQGTFDAIIDNLRILRNSDIEFEIALRIHINKDNYSELNSLAEILKAEFSNDSRFKVYLKGIENLGGAGADCATSLKSNFELDKLLELFPVNMRLNQSRSTPNVCYAAAGNSLVVRSTGEVCKCTVALEDPANKIGKISSDGNIEADSVLYSAWVSTLFKPSEAKCPLYAINALLKP